MKLIYTIYKSENFFVKFSWDWSTLGFIFAENFTFAKELQLKGSVRKLKDVRPNDISSNFDSLWYTGNKIWTFPYLYWIKFVGWHALGKRYFKSRQCAWSKYFVEWVQRRQKSDFMRSCLQFGAHLRNLCIFIFLKFQFWITGYNEECFLNF